MTQAATTTPQAAPIHTAAILPTSSSPAVQASQFQQALRFTVTLPHSESYFPTPRHKKPSERPAEAVHTYFVNFTTRQEAPLVLIERTPNTVYAYRLYNGQLYREAKSQDRTDYTKCNALTLDAIIEDLKDRNNSHWNLERNQAAHQKTLEGYLVIAGRLYEKHLEPCYVVERSGLRVAYGISDQTYKLTITFNALEYQAAYDLAHPVTKSRKYRRIFNKQAQNQAVIHTLKVIDPSTVKIPLNAELSQHFENLEVQRGAVFITEKLGQFGTPLRKRILERSLEMHINAQSSN
jgi:hypothetical protein